MYSARTILKKEAQAFNGYGLEWDSSLFLSVFHFPGQGEVQHNPNGCKKSFLKVSRLRVAVSLHNKRFPGYCSAVPLHWLCKNNCGNSGMFFLSSLLFFL